MIFLIKFLVFLSFIYIGIVIVFIYFGDDSNFVIFIIDFFFFYVLFEFDMGFFVFKVFIELVLGFVNFFFIDVVFLSYEDYVDNFDEFGCCFFEGCIVFIIFDGVKNFVFWFGVKVL